MGKRSMAPIGRWLLLLDLDTDAGDGAARVRERRRDHGHLRYNYPPMSAPDSRPTFRFRDLELDVAAYQLRRRGRPVPLERRAWTS